MAAPTATSSAAAASSCARLPSASLRAPRAAVSFPSRPRPAPVTAHAGPSRRPGVVLVPAAAGHQKLMGSLTNEGLRFGVVVARFNEVVTNLLLQGALEAFERYSVKPENITVVSVPGSFEVPLRAADASSFPASHSCRTRPSSPQSAGLAHSYSRFPPSHSRSATGTTSSVSPTPACAGDTGELSEPLQPNARRRELDPHWHGGGFSLGVDLGDSRTGLAVGRGITLPRPLTVLKLRGQKLELMLLDIARQQEADELIVGLPLSADGRETPQSNKVRSVVGRLAVQAAERGLRVYLLDEHGTSMEALDFMISRGVKKSSRDVKSDAYAAVMILERYFSLSGQGANIVLPKQQELKEKLISQARRHAEI